MRFLRRNQYFLLCLAFVLFSCVMVVWQFRANASAHTQRVEDFILLHEKGEARLCEQRYQRLIQELPALDDKTLVDDLQRTGMLVDPKAPNPDSLLWKFHVSTQKELQKRSEQRLGWIRGQSQKP